MTAPDLLAAIAAATRRVVEVRRRELPAATLERRAAASGRKAGRFRAVFERAERLNVIAECKRRSPSSGVLRAQYDPAALARTYARAGAAAISVLTEPTFFDGSLEHLRAIRTAVDLPLLRKDFIVSEYQLLEASAAGADAVLLIVAALEPSELGRLHDQARGFGLDVLVEIHDARELAAALDVGACIIGVNNRNLRTLEVNMATSDELVAGIPEAIVAISESGLRTAGDLLRLRKLGYRGFLIGERFMTVADPGAALEELITACL